MKPEIPSLSGTKTGAASVRQRFRDELRKCLWLRLVSRERAESLDVENEIIRRALRPQLCCLGARDCVVRAVQRSARRPSNRWPPKPHQHAQLSPQRSHALDSALLRVKPSKNRGLQTGAEAWAAKARPRLQWSPPFGSAWKAKRTRRGQQVFPSARRHTRPCRLTQIDPESSIV